MSGHGLCDRDQLHPAHEFHDGIGMWHCPGQYSVCRNCDDRKCMCCVFRAQHDACRDDCPSCCATPQAPLSVSGPLGVVGSADSPKTPGEPNSGAKQ